MRHYSYVCWATLAIGFAAPSLQAQSTWLRKLKIRQSFSEDESKQNPAVLSVTVPKEKATSVSVDLGLSYPLHSDATGLRSGNLVTEYHYNNQTDKEVNNFQIGYKHIWIFQAPQVGLPAPGVIPNYKSGRLNSVLNFRNDNVEGSKGAAGSFTFGFFQQGNAYKTWWNATKFLASQRFHYILSPEAGFEWQQNFKAENTVNRGFFLRPLVRMAVGFGQARPDPSSNLPDGIWLFNVDAAMRYDLIGNQVTDSRLHPLIKTSLDFFLLYKPVKLVLGGSFAYGDNPIEGFKEIGFKPQQSWVIAFKVQK